MQHVTVDDRPAPILVQRATGARKNKTLTETLAPMIHSVFRNSVKNGGTERATTITVCNIFARSKFCSQLYCGYLAWSTAALKSFRYSLILSHHVFGHASGVLASLDCSKSRWMPIRPTQHVTVDDRPAPILMQRATWRENLETCGNSISIIHSVSHNSVENQALENAVKVLLGATFRGKCCENFCGSSGKNKGSRCVRYPASVAARTHGC
jgi:hypothetical protein